MERAIDYLIVQLYISDPSRHCDLVGIHELYQEIKTRRMPTRKQSTNAENPYCAALSYVHQLADVYDYA